MVRHGRVWVDAEKVERGREDVFGRDRGFRDIAALFVGAADDLAFGNAAAGEDRGIRPRPVVSPGSLRLRVDRVASAGLSTQPFCFYFFRLRKGSGSFGRSRVLSARTNVSADWMPASAPRRRCIVSCD